jgi:chromosomal replication initiator protein
MEDTLWPRIKEKLRASLPPHTFQSFVECAKFENIDEENLSLSFPDSFTKSSFEDRCLPVLKETLNSLSMAQLGVALSVIEGAGDKRQSMATAMPVHRNPFDSKYTFDTFVIGSSNQFAHAACQAVSKQPGQCYNPLFIFGAAGLGKTHLLRAIGYEIHQQQKDLKILFLTSESFTNELIQAISLNRMREFREKYRNSCDVLLLDDIHFMAGKERTQEEFFYTFNYLHECRKQIVITSDRYPKDIQGLENRLQTRFEWGLVADVQPPEIETRIAILKNKADEQHICLPDEVAAYIASNITTNIRELEGSLHRLQAYASLSGIPISQELAQQILRDISPKQKHEVTPQGILTNVAIYFNIKTVDIKSEKRIRKLSLPRQICMYLIRKRLLLSLPEIGKFMGGRDHTTVMHAVEKITSLLKTDPEIENHVTKIESMIR